MSHRYTHFLIDVPIAGDPDLIAQADDDHLLDHAEDTLVETVGETAAGWFEPDSVKDGTATFRLRVGTSHAGEPADTEALHAALRVVREHAGRDNCSLDVGALQYDCVTPTGPLGEPDAGDSKDENTGDIDSDTETDSDSDTDETVNSDPANDAEPDTDDRKFGIERDPGDDGRQGLLASAMRGDG